MRLFTAIVMATLLFGQTVSASSLSVQGPKHSPSVSQLADLTVVSDQHFALLSNAEGDLAIEAAALGPKYADYTPSSRHSSDEWLLDSHHAVFPPQFWVGLVVFSILTTVCVTAIAADRHTTWTTAACVYPFVREVSW